MKNEPIFKPGDRVYWMLSGRRRVLCPTCDGSGISGYAGRSPEDYCIMCGGKGYVSISDPDDANKITGTVIGLQKHVIPPSSNMYYVDSDVAYAGSTKHLIFEGLLHFDEGN